MTTAPIPTGAPDLTAAWFTASIGAAFGGSVVGVTPTPIGTGQIADSIRVELTWDPPGCGPPTLVTKVTSAVEASKQAALATRTYEVEVGFYRDMADRVAVRRPECHWTGFDPTTGAYAVVLEDLAPAHQGDQMAGCSVDEAGAALDELALLHGPVWGASGLGGMEWLRGGGGTSSPGIGAFLQNLLPGFLDRYQGRFSEPALALIERAVPKLGSAAPVAGPVTVVHGDFRNDNLMFGGERVCVLDWQTVSIGHAMADVSYFLGGSLVADDRRSNERDLVERYRERLASQGAELSADECWTGYRRFAFSGLNMAILASMMVGRTDRGDDMFVTMAERAAQHALDVDAEEFLNP